MRDLVAKIRADGSAQQCAKFECNVLTEYVDDPLVLHKRGETDLVFVSVRANHARALTGVREVQSH